MKNVIKIMGLFLCVICLSSCAELGFVKQDHYQRVDPFASFTPPATKLKLGVGFVSSHPGVYVNSVQPNSLAHNAGIIVGDVILVVDDLLIQDGHHFQRMLKAATGKVVFGIINPNTGEKFVIVDFGGEEVKEVPGSNNGKLTDVIKLDRGKIKTRPASIELTPFEFAACDYAESDAKSLELVLLLIKNDMAHKYVRCQISSDDSSLVAVIIDNAGIPEPGKNCHTFLYDKRDIHGRTLLDYLDTYIVFSGPEKTKVIQEYIDKIEARNGKRASDLK